MQAFRSWRPMIMETIVHPLERAVAESHRDGGVEARKR
jgi:hypothetical protein